MMPAPDRHAPGRQEMTTLFPALILTATLTAKPVDTYSDNSPGLKAGAARDLASFRECPSRRGERRTVSTREDRSWTRWRCPRHAVRKQYRMVVASRQGAIHPPA